MKEEKPEQYALVRLDKLRKWPQAGLMAIRAAQAIDTLEKMGLLEYGENGSKEESLTPLASREAKDL